MMRAENWPERLDAFLAAQQHRAFTWGGFDCALFAADWVLACTGVDPAAPYRGAYSDGLEAARLQRQDGGLEAMITAALGEPIAPAFAQRGDIVLLDAELRPTAGVCVGWEAAAPGMIGLEFLPMARASRAWRV